MAANKQLSAQLVKEICNQTNIDKAIYYQRISHGGRFHSIFPNLPVNTRHWICAEQDIEQETYEDENDSPNSNLNDVFTRVNVRNAGHPRTTANNSPGLPGLPNVPIGNYFDSIAQENNHNQTQHAQRPQRLAPSREQQQQQANNQQPQRIEIQSDQQQLGSGQQQFQPRQQQNQPRQPRRQRIAHPNATGNTHPERRHIHDLNNPIPSITGRKRKQEDAEKADVDCKYETEFGKCHKGNKCKFHHNPSNAFTNATLTNPPRNPESLENWIQHITNNNPQTTRRDCEKEILMAKQTHERRVADYRRTSTFAMQRKLEQLQKNTAKFIKQLDKKLPQQLNQQLDK